MLGDDTISISFYFCDTIANIDKSLQRVRGETLRARVSIVTNVRRVRLALKFDPAVYSGL